jgi:hypothetical protein
MRPPKPQMWTREYLGGMVIRIETATEGRWQVIRDGGTAGSVSPTYRLEAMQAHADALSGKRARGPWRRRCRCGEAPMTLDLRNRPDGGPPGNADSSRERRGRQRSDGAILRLT